MIHENMVQKIMKITSNSYVIIYAAGPVLVN